MSVEFNDESQYGSGSSYGGSMGGNGNNGFNLDQSEDQRPIMVKWLMKMGVKSETTANGLLIAIAILFIILSVVIYFVFV